MRVFFFVVAKIRILLAFLDHPPTHPRMLNAGVQNTGEFNLKNPIRNRMRCEIRHENVNFLKQ